MYTKGFVSIELLQIGVGKAFIVLSWLSWLQTRQQNSMQCTLILRKQNISIFFVLYYDKCACVILCIGECVHVSFCAWANVCMPVCVYMCKV